MAPVTVNPVLLNVTVAPRAKFVPVMVSVASVPAPADDGVTVVIVGAPPAVTVNDFDVSVPVLDPLSSYTV